MAVQEPVIPMNRFAQRGSDDAAERPPQVRACSLKKNHTQLIVKNKKNNLSPKQILQSILLIGVYQHSHFHYVFKSGLGYLG
jgi:hypothetical protein